MRKFDYNAAAELFATPTRLPHRRSLDYRRFAQAVDAIRFAIEDLPRKRLVGAFLEVGEQRYNNNEIRRLYENIEYPLTRRSTRHD